LLCVSLSRKYPNLSLKPEKYQNYVIMSLEREEKTIYMGCFCRISLIAKYFAISEMYRICLCTIGVAPRVPYPLEVSEVR